VLGRVRAGDRLEHAGIRSLGANLGTEPPDGRDLRRRRVLRHEHDPVPAQRLQRVGDAEAVIAGRRGHDATLALFRRQGQDLRHRTPRLERTVTDNLERSGSRDYRLDGREIDKPLKPACKFT
jgi:hypothetical protein